MRGVSKDVERIAKVIWRETASGDPDTPDDRYGFVWCMEIPVARAVLKEMELIRRDRETEAEEWLRKNHEYLKKG
jgi:hypothetical protein